MFLSQYTPITPNTAVGNTRYSRFTGAVKVLTVTVATIYISAYLKLRTSSRNEELSSNFSKFSLVYHTQTKEKKKGRLREGEREREREREREPATDSLVR